MVARHYWELTAWQAVVAFKKGIYDLIEREPLATDLNSESNYARASPRRKVILLAAIIF